MSVAKKNGIPSGWKKDDRDLLKQKPKGIKVRSNASNIGRKVLQKRKYQALKNKHRFHKESSISELTAKEKRLSAQKYGWRSNRTEHASWHIPSEQINRKKNPWQNSSKINVSKEERNYETGKLQSTYRSSVPREYSNYKTNAWQNNSEQTVFVGTQNVSEQTIFSASNKEQSNVFGSINPITNNSSSQFGSQISDSASKMIDASTNVAPPVAIAKKGIEISKQSLEKIIQKLQQHHHSKIENSKKNSDTPDITGAMAAIGVAMFLLLSVMVTTVMPVFMGAIAPISVGAILPAVVSLFFETESSIIDVAKYECENYEDNIGGEKYKEYFGYSGNWCAMFVSWCANECGYIDAEIMPKLASVQQMAGWYKDRDQWRDKEGYTPKAGDIVFFQNGMSHVGIVIEYDSSTNKITTIEGNTGSSDTEIYHHGSRVKQKTYSITYTKITGYGLPNYPLLDIEDESE